MINICRDFSLLDSIIHMSLRILNLKTISKLSKDTKRDTRYIRMILTK